VDERSLTPAEPADVMRRMADAFLAAPRINPQQGEIRLAPHQVDAASRLLRLLGDCGGAVLADATGLGKTFVAIAIARVLGPALVVAPAALRGMWRDALRRTGVESHFESYEALSRGHVPARAALLLLDEAHHARNPRARRSSTLADLAWGSKVLLLTATPIHNRRRDLQALLALFIGSRAETMPDEEIRRLVVRRTSGSWSGVVGLPLLRKPHWLEVPGDHETLRAIKALPPAVPVSDGAPAHALLLLGLIRAWSSSEAALTATLKRRLRRAAVVSAMLEGGRLPDRRELGSWPVVDDAIQLGFPELFATNQGAVDIVRLKEMLEAHVSGIRAILQVLDGRPDEARMMLLRSVRGVHAPTPIIAFSQFADTANAAFHGCANAGGLALVTGRGARIASGRVTAEEVVRGFDVDQPLRSNAMPLDLLIATDVLSEGLSLRQAGVILHLDLPWTIARLEQRVGRLRRLGSPHQCISVYAIGPPVAARELVSVVRALQRKARLSSAVTGIDELGSALPLLGQRLARATAMIPQHGDPTAAEELRRVMASWIQPSLPEAVGQRPATIALVECGKEFRLLSVTNEGVSDNPSDVLRACRAMSATCHCAETHSFGEELAAIENWLQEQRSHAIAQLATDNPSAAHTDVLRELQQILVQSSRTERPALVRRIESCRQLVLRSRGMGAELALARVMR